MLQTFCSYFATCQHLKTPVCRAQGGGNPSLQHVERGSQAAATSDPKGHGKEPAAHLQIVINHRSYLSIPLLCFRGWLGLAVVCKRLLMLHSQAKHWAGGLGTTGNKLFPRGGRVCVMQSPQHGGLGKGDVLTSPFQLCLSLYSACGHLLCAVRALPSPL